MAPINSLLARTDSKNINKYGRNDDNNNNNENR